MKRAACCGCGGSQGRAYPLAVDAIARDGRLFRRGALLCLACVLVTMDAPVEGAGRR